MDKISFEMKKLLVSLIQVSHKKNVYIAFTVWAIPRFVHTFETALFSADFNHLEVHSRSEVPMIVGYLLEPKVAWFGL